MAIMVMTRRAARPRARFFVICLLVLLTVLPLFAADPAPATEPASAPSSAEAEVLPRSVLLFCRFDEGDGFSLGQRQLLMESLVIKLGAASPEIRLRQYPSGTGGEDSELDKIALLSGADAWLSVVISGSMEQAQLMFRARDIQKNQDFFALELSAVIDSRFRNAFGGLWSPVIRQMQEKIHPFRQFNTLKIHGPADTKLSISGKHDLTLDKDGQGSLELVSPASYAWSLYLPGFKPASGTVFLETDTTLDIKPVARLPASFGVGLEWLCFPSLDLQVFLLPDSLSLEIGGVLYDLGINPSNPTDAGAYVIKSHGLFNLLAGLRWQFLTHAYPVQLSAGLGGQLRWLTKDTVRVDPITPGGLYLALGVSADILPEVAIFMDLMPRFSFTTDPAIATSNLAKVQQTTGLGNLTLGEGPLLIEPLHFVLGMRIQP